MRPAGRRIRAIADYKSTTELQRRSESSTSYTEWISQYVLQNTLVAMAMKSSAARSNYRSHDIQQDNQMTYSLTTSLLPFVFCVLGIVGGYYIFRT